jgi:hypothetical protein
MSRKEVELNNIFNFHDLNFSSSERLRVTNTLAYYGTEFITVKESFITSTSACPVPDLQREDVETSQRRRRRRSHQRREAPLP